MTWQVPLADVKITAQDLQAVTLAYESGWLSMGPRTEQFEAALSTYLGVEHAVAVSSGTAALHLMYTACGLGPGDEVIVPSMTFVATAAALRHVGATPVFADVASEALPLLFPAAVEHLITERTRAIVHVPYAGHPAHVGELQQLAESRGLLFLQDAAHALGARAGDRPVPAVGHAAALSFFANKNLAVGEGGAMVTNDPGVARRVRLLRSHGMTAVSWDRQQGRAAGYDVEAVGFNYRFDDPRAALALHRLEGLDAANARRAILVARYREALDGRMELGLPDEPGSVSAHHLFVVLLDAGAEREEVRASMARRGVQSSVHYPPVHGFAAFAGHPVEVPVTESYAARTLTLPLFPHMTEGQQAVVVEALLAAR